MGKHAGGWHPRNFEDPPLSAHHAVWQLMQAEDHGKHAGLADTMAEKDAWEMEVDYL